MAEKYRHHYVSQALVSNWSEDGKHASWYEPTEDRSIKKGGISRYFHENLTDLTPEYELTLDRIDIFFSGLVKTFLDGDFDDFKEKDLMSAREIMMFQLLRTPSGVFSPGKMISKLTYGTMMSGSGMTKKERKEMMRTEEITDALNQMIIYGIDILDMEAVLLKAPENSSFILGSVPVTQINPYFSEEEPDVLPGMQSFELWGAVLVLPLSPDSALCLYDPETYTPEEKDGVCVLTVKDMDMLNTAMLYNGGKEGGFIHTCGEDYIDALMQDLDDDDFYRESFFGDLPHEYPFETELSVLKVRKEAQKKIRERERSVIRPYISAIVDYDDEHLDNMHGKNSIRVYAKRLEDAGKILAKVRNEGSEEE